MLSLLYLKYCVKKFSQFVINKVLTNYKYFYVKNFHSYCDKLYLKKKI